jgi:hypothetical protein
LFQGIGETTELLDEIGEWIILLDIALGLACHGDLSLRS